MTVSYHRGGHRSGHRVIRLSPGSPDVGTARAIHCSQRRIPIRRAEMSVSIFRMTAPLSCGFSPSVPIQAGPRWTPCVARSRRARHLVSATEPSTDSSLTDHGDGTAFLRHGPPGARRRWVLRPGYRQVSNGHPRTAKDFRSRLVVAAAVFAGGPNDPPASREPAALTRESRRSTPRSTHRILRPPG